MTLTNKLKEKISIEVIKTLITRFENFPEDASNNRNAPFHEAFLNAFSDKLNEKVHDIPFFIRLSSWQHGLSTTLGQKFFENVARNLCDGKKKEYTSKKLGNLQITETQKANITNIITNLSNTTSTPDLSNENSLIYNNYDTPLVSAIDFSADVFIEDTDTITAIELKSVKPNSGEMRGEKQKILEGKAALFRLFPDKQIKFYIGFPFDPTVNPANESVTSFDKPRFLSSIINLTKYFDSNEVLIANELWDMLSGQENTMEAILYIINSISTTDFLTKFQLLTDNTKRLTPEYRNQLSEWNLFSEIELIDNNNTIIQKIGTNNALTKKYNKMAFNSKGNYCTDRYATLKELLTNYKSNV